uniref:ATP synthase F0 subunit 8 n=1 Tax=Opamata lipcowa TaxID=2893141 RepID=A0A9E7BVI7_9HEMI|nr:ATP synthase F0 subunit 8 [Opamata lipcowa]UGN61553.1 ATP synthase F0 subunit 8 [Opamata lipcowa]
MPQMSPMWWTSLMVMFITSIMICMYILYFNYTNKMTANKKYLHKNMNWTW